MKSYDNTICRDVLSAIDDVTIMEQSSGIDVISSLIDVYDKGYETFSNYEGSSSDAFKIFGESFVMEEDDSAIQQGTPDKDANVQAKKKEDGFFYKLIHFIPNLLSKLWNLIKNAWNGKVVPAAEQAAEKAGGISGKVKDIMDKIRGKEPSWVKEHHKELGIGASALGAVLAWLAYLKRNDIAVIAKKWFDSIKNFFKQTKDDAKEISIIFETTVSGNLKTNFNIKNIGLLFKKYIPDFFKAVREYLKSTKKKKIEAKQQTEFIQKNIIIDSNDIVGTEIISEKEINYDSVQYFEFMNAIDDAMKNNLKNECGNIVNEMKNVENNFTDENINGEDADKDLFKKIYAQVLNIVKNLTGVISSTVTNFMSLFKKVQESSTEELKVVAALNNNDGVVEETPEETPEETSEETSEETPEETHEEEQNGGATEEVSKEEKSKVDAELDAKIKKAQAKYDAWAKEHPNAEQRDKNNNRKKFAKEVGLKGEDIAKVIAEFTKIYGTREFGDIAYQESFFEEYYYDDEDDDIDDQSSSWYNR